MYLYYFSWPLNDGRLNDNNGVPVIYGMMLAFLMNLNKWIFAHFLGFEAPDRWDPGNPIYGEPVWNTLFGMEIFSFTSALGMMWIFLGLVYLEMEYPG